MTANAPAKPLCALVIDDEPQILRLLTLALESNGYRVSTARNGQEGLAAVATSRHDIVLLDLGLPDVNGVLVLKQLRGWSQVPVVILTVQDSESDKIEALDAGADDYVTKPFNTGELLARMRASLRRADRGEARAAVFQAGPLTVDFATRKVALNDEPVKLTATEYALLQLFIRHAGKVLTHRYLLHEIWGPEHEAQTQYLRVYITRLREKLEANPSAPTLFLTEIGVGYRFQEA
jgi:two-component system, OmpR family, KDP operon response regulator KdpE